MIGTAIYSLIGGVGRVYPLRATQGEPWPFAVYNILSATPIGTKQTPSVIDVYQIQINIYSEQYAQLDELDIAIRSILDGFSGTQDSTVFDSVRMTSREDGFDTDYYVRTVMYQARVLPENNLT
jgi:hypothetical protein